MKNRKQPTPKGFSLIELIFAVALLTIVVLGVVKLQTSNLVLTNTQNNEALAYLYANEGLEIVEALGKGAISTACAAPPCDLELSFAADTYSLSTLNAPTETIGIFSRTINISTDANFPDAYITEAKVGWTDSTGSHEVTAKRLIHE